MREFAGYFDETGDLVERDRVFGICGYYLSADDAKEMEREWLQVLSDHALPFFHMVDCAHKSGHFSNKSKDECIEIQTKLIELIKKYTISGLSIIACGDEIEDQDNWDDAYVYCTESAVKAVEIFQKVQRIEGPVAYFFEAGHADQRKAKTNLASQIGSKDDSVSFGSKTVYPLLQAADILAWQSRKYVADMRSQTRPPRKDLLSLFEHTHDLFYITKFGRGGAIALESWPLHRRSSFTVAMTPHERGPFYYFTEEGDNEPILPVDMTLGSGPGGGRLIKIFFRDVRGSRFSLAFDEMRVQEAANVIRMAAAIYGTQFHESLLIPQAASIEKREDHILLRFDLGNLMSVRMPLDLESASRFLDELTQVLKS